MIISDENFDIVLIFAQNFDCGYTLEPPQGPMPSRPVDFPGSSLRMKATTCDVVMSGIWKKVSDGTLLFT